MANQQLITKVYFPRLVIPLAAVMAGLVDFAIAFVVLLGMMVCSTASHSVAEHAVPAVLPPAGPADRPDRRHVALGPQRRIPGRQVYHPLPDPVLDVRHPHRLLGTLVPEQWRWLYSLNPMYGVVEGFRWALLGREGFSLPFFLLSVGVVLVLFVGGLAYFRHMEDSLRIMLGISV